MKSDKLNAHEIVSRCNALGHVEVLPPCILDHTIDTPLTVGVGKTVLSDLEPTKATGASACGIVDLGEPGADRS